MEAQGLEKGLEVAQKAAEIQQVEHDIRVKQVATEQSWERTQQREITSLQHEHENWRDGSELVRARAAINKDVHAIQSNDSKLYRSKPRSRDRLLWHKLKCMNEV